MLQRHDFVTPYVNGLRFFDKPPLMYWMAAGSMHVFGIYDWAARLPLALGVLALLLAVYALGNRLFRGVSPAAHPDRAGLYSALAVATGIGPYLYTRFYIPDILIALWMTLAVHLFLIALERLAPQRVGLAALPRLRRRHGPQRPHQGPHRSRLPHRLRPALPRDHPPAPPAAAPAPALGNRRLPRHRRALAHPGRTAEPRHRAARRPRPARPRRLGLVLPLQRAHRPLPLQAHPPRLRPDPGLALLALPRHLGHALGDLPSHRHRRPRPHPPQAARGDDGTGHRARSRPRAPALGRPRARLLLPLRPAGVLLAARAARPRADGRRPARARRIRHRHQPERTTQRPAAGPPGSFCPSPRWSR